jgi:hypothetical protein
MPAIGALRARGHLRIGALTRGGENHATPRASSALTFQGPAPGDALAASSPLVVAMLTPPLCGEH